MSKCVTRPKGPAVIKRKSDVWKYLDNPCSEEYWDNDPWNSSCLYPGVVVRQEIAEKIRNNRSAYLPLIEVLTWYIQHIIAPAHWYLNSTSTERVLLRIASSMLFNTPLSIQDKLDVFNDMIRHYRYIKLKEQERKDYCRRLQKHRQACFWYNLDNLPF